MYTGFKAVGYCIQALYLTLSSLLEGCDSGTAYVYPAPLYDPLVPTPPTHLDPTPSHEPTQHLPVWRMTLRRNVMVTFDQIFLKYLPCVFLEKTIDCLGGFQVI